MRFDLSLLRCVVSLGVFVGLTGGTAFAQTRLEVVVHDCPNGNQIASLYSQIRTAEATEEDIQYGISKRLALQEFACSENANVNKYSREVAKLFYVGDLEFYGEYKNLSMEKRYKIYLHVTSIYKILEESVFPDIAKSAKASLPFVDKPE